MIKAIRQRRAIVIARLERLYRRDKTRAVKLQIRLYELELELLDLGIPTHLIKGD